MVFALGNTLLYFFLQEDSMIDLMRVVMCSAVFTVIHIFICIGTGLTYRILLDVTSEGRGWFWSAIMVSLLGISYYGLLTYSF